MRTLLGILTIIMGMALAPSIRAGEDPALVRIAVSYSIRYDDGSRKRGGNILVSRIIEEGWLEAQLKERGIQLAWYPIVGALGPLTNEAFAADRIDFALMGELPIILLNASGVRTKMIVPIGRGTDLFLVVPNDSSATSIRDLKGKRVSVQKARPWELGFRQLIEENGLTYRDFRTFNMENNASLAALASGQIDALFSSSGYILEDRKIGRIIWSSKNTIEYKVRTGDLWVAQLFVDRYPEVTQLVTTAYVRAGHWVSQDENREVAIQDATADGTPESVVRRNYEDLAVSWRDRWSMVFDPYIFNYYRNAVEASYKAKLIPRPLNADEMIEPRFLEAALRELNLTEYWKQYPATRFGKPKEHQ